MRIGLVRHFKVNITPPKKFLLSHTEICDWFDTYNSSADLKFKPIDNLNINWHKCYASPLLRAQLTAREFYAQEIITHTSLIELNIIDTLKSSFRLPFLVWATWTRIKSFQQNKITLLYRKAIHTFLDDVMQADNQDILIVSHYFTMKELREELLKRGFKNGNYNAKAYGELFLFEK